MEEEVGLGLSSIGVGGAGKETLDEAQQLTFLHAIHPACLAAQQRGQDTLEPHRCKAAVVERIVNSAEFPRMGHHVTQLALFVSDPAKDISPQARAGIYRLYQLLLHQRGLTIHGAEGLWCWDWDQDSRLLGYRNTARVREFGFPLEEAQELQTPDPATRKITQLGGIDLREVKDEVVGTEMKQAEVGTNTRVEQAMVGPQALTEKVLGDAAAVAKRLQKKLVASEQALQAAVDRNEWLQEEHWDTAVEKDCVNSGSEQGLRREQGRQAEDFSLLTATPSTDKVQQILEEVRALLLPSCVGCQTRQLLRFARKLCQIKTCLAGNSQ
ncbi:hypothetical protein UY3_13586 [Chelonia mydas]|uniref:Maestro-like HEAT-repeats domain-containing protein n=1 Tax=Chelonia mydas TaxID=8469 RepID=M7BAW8_CHEMY|nr:hypothetical protein UY3_13586 [Chelonia mydas]